MQLKSLKAIKNGICNKRITANLRLLGLRAFFMSVPNRLPHIIVVELWLHTKREGQLAN